MKTRAFIVVLITMIFCGVYLAKESTIDKPPELTIGAALACVEPTIVVEEPLNFGSLIGSFSTRRTISLNLDGDVTQSANSYIGLTNYKSLNKDHVSQPGIIDLAARRLIPGSRLSVKLDQGFTNPDFHIDNLIIGLASTNGLTQIISESTSNKLVLEVTSSNASAKLNYVGTLNINNGYHGPIKATVPISVSWDCA